MARTAFHTLAWSSQTNVSEFCQWGHHLSENQPEHKTDLVSYVFYVIFSPGFYKGPWSLRLKICPMLVFRFFFFKCLKTDDSRIKYYILGFKTVELHRICHFWPNVHLVPMLIDLPDIFPFMALANVSSLKIWSGLGVFSQFSFNIITLWEYINNN